MAGGVSLQLPPHQFGVMRKHSGLGKRFKSSEMRSWRHLHLPSLSLSSRGLRKNVWSLQVTDRIYMQLHCVPCRYNHFTCRCSVVPNFSDGIPLLKNTTLALTRSYNVLKESHFVSKSFTVLMESPLVMQLVPAIGVIAFAVWGVGPLMRYSRSLFLHNDNNWKKSKTHYVFTSYLQPLLLWTGATLVCRALDPVILPSAASQTVKKRLLNFVQSLSTVLAFAYCLTSLIQQTQKFFMEKNSSNDTRNMGFQFAGKAVYSAVWIAALSLFMELLGFSTQKWVTAGGLGTVLLTLAGREIFTNFLSGIMIHATRPFVPNEWIQAKIQGYEVSGTVEHVGWWSPTVIRGDDREAIHIPNHKFTVNVVRNLSQKTHWRIKTHLAISHLDVNKINNIVADMRKVLAKNPQIEQQRLHRRVFLENINPENQALLILISCFVKTSHFEEYLCVKEAVLLDLLRVISHHRARLATPIRTMQKFYNDADIDNIPFSDSIFTHSGRGVNRPLLLIEPPPRINGDDKAKLRTTPRPNEEQTLKSTASSEPKPTTVIDGTQSSSEKQQQPRTTPRPNEEQAPKSTTSSEPNPTTVIDGTRQSSSEKQQQLRTTPRPNDEQVLKSTASSEPKPTTVIHGTTQSSSEKQQQPRTTPRPNEEQALKSTASSEPKHTTVIDGTTQSISEKQQQKKSSSGEIRPKNSKGDSTPVSSSNLPSKSQLEGTENSPRAETASKQVEVTVPPTVKNESVAKPYEGNLVLDVAIEGSKKTLPIEEEEIKKPVPLPAEASEMATSRSGNGSSPSNVKDRKGQMPAADQRDQER